MKDDLTKWKPEPGKPITMADIYCHGGDWAECCRRVEFLKPPPIEEDPVLHSRDLHGLHSPDRRSVGGDTD